MKTIIAFLIIFSIMLPSLIKAQQDVAVSIKTVESFSVTDPPNFVLTSSNQSPYFYDKWGQLKGINDNSFVTNVGGAGIINVEIKVDEFTENKQFTVEGSTSYALVTSIPVWQGAGVEMIMSSNLPGSPITKTFGNLSATGDTETTLDPSLEPRNWYWFAYKHWDFENLIYANNMFTVVGEIGQIFTSFDGQGWASRNSGTTEDLSGVAYGNGLWVITGWDGYIYTSENTETWVERLVVIDWLAGVTYGNGNFVAVGASIYTSADGITWTKVNNESYNFSGITYVNNNFIAVGDGIYTSTDGTSWTQVLPQPTNTHISGIAYGNGVYVAVGWVWDSGRGDGVVYTSSNSSDWVQQTMNVAGVKGLDKVAFGNGNFMCVGYNGAVLKSAAGVTWSVQLSGTIEILTGVAFGNNQYVTVGVNGNILNFGEITGISDELNYLPEKFILYQNYPNPFNPTTTIKYVLPEISQVSLKVYDLIGREVASLVNEEKQPGRYEVRFDGSNLASGVYFYRLQAGSFVQTRKLVLMK